MFSLSLICPILYEGPHLHDWLAAVAELLPFIG